MVDFLFAKGVHKDAPNKVREGRGWEGMLGIQRVSDSCWGGWSKVAECQRADEGRQMCTPVYRICSADLVGVTSQFTGWAHAAARRCNGRSTRGGAGASGGGGGHHREEHCK